VGLLTVIFAVARDAGAMGAGALIVVAVSAILVRTGALDPLGT
jgi:hypothetical protein